MSKQIDAAEYEQVAASCNAFRSVELELLRETLETWNRFPSGPYTLLDLRDGKRLAAFAVLCRAQGRESTYEIRYVCVDRDFHASVGGQRILEMIEEEILRLHPHALIQLEMSTNKLRCLGNISPERAGYGLIGHIVDFYGEGDDYFMYTKFVPPAKPRAKPAKAKKAAPPETPPAAAANSDGADCDSAGLTAP